MQIITHPSVASIGSLSKRNSIIITDENLFNIYQNKIKHYQTIVLKAGEQFKTQATVDNIIEQLILMSANRNTTLVGFGGGVVSDITGYVASVFMRGVDFGFVPTSLLAMVDASIGGKNGIDVGVYKNMIGTINQPKFILHDYVLLNTLPQAEWENGFAEIIKHACINDAEMFVALRSNSFKHYQTKKNELALLIQQNAAIKLKIVEQDVFEKGNRKLLNFGHTLGHAIENLHHLSHGQAIAIGMVFACQLSQQILGFKQSTAVVELLQQYDLPTEMLFNKQEVFDILKMDKKREKTFINYILLEKIGKAKIVDVELKQIKKIIDY
jgi:3-dehydroquinate synthase